MTTTGIIFDIKKFAIHDGPGIRTTVFFKGCPLDCGWCHNPEGKNAEIEVLTVKGPDVGGSSTSSRTETVGRAITVTELVVEVTKDRIFYDQSGGGVTFSGGEPMMQLRFLLASLRASKENGLHTVVDTSGYASWQDFDMIRELVDLFLYDLKIIDDKEHAKHTGLSSKPILENLTKLSENGCSIQPRVPLIPGITDTDANLESIAGFLDSIRTIHEIVLLPYNRLGEDKLRRFNMQSNLPRLATQTAERLDRIARIFRSRGHTVRFGG